MFWFKSNLKRDLKVFREILDQLENLDINDKFTRSNAFTECKSILKELYPKKFEHYINDDWKSHLYGLSADGQKDLIDEEKDYLDELKNMDEGEISHLTDKLDIVDAKEEHKQFIKDAERKIKFLKSDARIQLIIEIRTELAGYQKDKDKKEFNKESFDMLKKFELGIYTKLGIKHHYGSG